MNFNISTKKNIFRNNVKWQFIGSAFQAILGGIFFLLIGNKLGATEFGIYSIIMGLVYTTNQLFEPRIQDVAARQFWNFEKESSLRSQQIYNFIDLFAIEICTKIFVLILILFLSPLVISTINLSGDHIKIITMAAIGFFFAKFGYGLSSGMLRVHGRSDLINICTTAELIIRLIMAYTLIEFNKLTVSNCVVLVGLSGSIFTIIQWLFLLKITGKISTEIVQWRPMQAIRRQRHNKRLILSSYGLSVADLMNKDLDLLLISTSLSTGQVGVYKMAKNITMSAWRAIDPFYLAMMPEICRLVALKKWEDINRFLFKISICLGLLASTLCFLSYFFVFVYGDYFLGTTFADISKLIAYMALGIIISAPLIWGHPLSVALNKPEIALKGSTIASVVGLIAFATLSNAYGIFGVGVAWIISFMFSFIYTALFSYAEFKKNLKIDE